jgi:hypothetical protein
MVEPPLGQDIRKGAGQFQSRPVSVICESVRARRTASSESQARRKKATRKHRPYATGAEAELHSDARSLASGFAPRGSIAMSVV